MSTSWGPGQASSLTTTLTATAALPPGAEGTAQPADMPHNHTGSIGCTPLCRAHPEYDQGRAERAYAALLAALEELPMELREAHIGHASSRREAGAAALVRALAAAGVHARHRADDVPGRVLMSLGQHSYMSRWTAPEPVEITAARARATLTDEQLAGAYLYFRETGELVPVEPVRERVAQARVDLARATGLHCPIGYHEHAAEACPGLPRCGIVT